MSSSPLVSLIMPVYTPRRDWLGQAVGAALGQTGASIELIVVDDGNDAPIDGLLADVDDGRLRVVRIEHGGTSAALNAGTQAARGEFLRFVAADDICPPDSTALLLRRALAHPRSIAYGATTLCDEQLRPRWTMTCRLQGDVLLACLLGRFTTRIPALLVPRAVAEAAGPWDASYPVSQDWEWVLRALEHAPVAGGRERTYLYRRHSASATRRLHEGEVGARRIVDAFLERHPELLGTATARQAEAMLLAYRSRIDVSHGRPGAAIAPALRSLLLHPRPLVEEATRSLRAASAIALHRVKTQ